MSQLAAESPAPDARRRIRGLHQAFIGAAIHRGGHARSLVTGSQQTLRQLKEVTYYDFDYHLPLVERFAVTAGTAARPATPEPE